MYKVKLLYICTSQRDNHYIVLQKDTDKYKKNLEREEKDRKKDQKGTQNRNNWIETWTKCAMFADSLYTRHIAGMFEYLQASNYQYRQLFVVLFFRSFNWCTTRSMSSIKSKQSKFDTSCDSIIMKSYIFMTCLSFIVCSSTGGALLLCS